jgi:hypothetical protein
VSIVWYPLQIYVAVVRESDGTYVATLPSVNGWEGEGKTPSAAVQALSYDLYKWLQEEA